MTGGPAMGFAAAKAPPFRLPGEHFTAAVVFLLGGAVGLTWIAPDLAAGAYPQPAVVGVTHLFTLGWITMSIMGALYQFLPVALGEPIRSIPAAHLTFALYAPGVAAFVAGMAFGRARLMLAGAALFGTGILIFASNLAATLWRAAGRDVTWWALAGADLFLVVTLVLGLALAGNLEWGYLGAARPIALGTHLHIALFGWVLLVVVGVAHRLLPMFLLSHGAGERHAKVAVGLLAAGAATLAVGHHGPPVVSRWLPALLFGSGLVALLLQARAFYRHRHRPALDPGMRSAAFALGVLVLALSLAGVALLLDPSPRASTAYVLALVLGLSLFVAALYYKIVPFLVWYHRFGRLAGKRKVSRVSDLYSARLAGTAGSLLLLGVLLLLAGVIAAQPALARGGATILTAGVALEALQMLALALRTP
ncbi:MAG TPA: hypothetical protein VFV65_05880 [Gemmatimonadales bacterium]|nr:hypothetical protein [Gemmatimonadales bacterium]